MDVERRLDELGVTLPAAAALPHEVEIPFAWVRARGERAFVSGHDALAADGSPAGPVGTVPSEVTLQEAQHSSRLATLAVLASLNAVLGDLGLITLPPQKLEKRARRPLGTRFQSAIRPWVPRLAASTLLLSSRIPAIP